MNVEQFQDWPDNNPEIPMTQEHGKKYFVRIVWSGEPHVNEDAHFIVKETLGIFIEDQHSPIAALNAAAASIVEAGAYITEMHYVASMDVTEDAIEKQIMAVEKSLVAVVDEAYIARAIENSNARIAFARKAAQHQAEAKNQVKH